MDLRLKSKSQTKNRAKLTFRTKGPANAEIEISHLRLKNSKAESLQINMNENLKSQSIRDAREFNKIKYYICIPFLASSVPNLSLDDFLVNADAPSGELDSDCGLGLQAELVASESGQQIGFSDAGIAYQHYLEQVIVVVVCSVRTHECLQCIYTRRVLQRVKFRERERDRREKREIYSKSL